MAKSGSGATTRRRPASGRPGGPQVTSQAVRMNLFVLVRILFQYLERVDKPVLGLAKEVLKDCERKHNSKDSKYETLADAIGERVRDAVGETHWARARQIQKQLVLNQQKKRLRAMQQARERGGPQQPLLSSQKSPQEPQRRQTDDEALEAAKAMSTMSQQAPPAPSIGNLFTAPKCADQQMEDGSTSATAQIPILGGQLSRTITDHESSSISRQELGGAAGLPSAGQLPLRKRITFAQAPPQSSSAPGTPPFTNFSTSHD